MIVEMMDRSRDRCKIDGTLIILRTCRIYESQAPQNYAAVQCLNLSSSNLQLALKNSKSKNWTDLIKVLLIINYSSVMHFPHFPIRSYLNLWYHKNDPVQVNACKSVLICTVTTDNCEYVVSKQMQVTPMPGSCVH